MKTYQQFIDEKYGAGLVSGGVIVYSLYKAFKYLRKKWKFNKTKKYVFDVISSDNSSYKYINSLNAIIDNLEKEQDISMYITNKYKKEFHYNKNTEEWHDVIRNFTNFMRNVVYKKIDQIDKEMKYVEEDKFNKEYVDKYLKNLDDFIKNTGYFKPKK